MAHFELTATCQGDPIRIRWEDGVITGNDVYAVTRLISETRTTLPVNVPAGPSWSGPAIIQNAIPVFMLADYLFDDVELVSGELPPLPKLPEGAIR